MKNVFLVMGILLCLVSCKKEENLDNSNKSKSDYLPMSVGNYWVYKITDTFPYDDTSYVAGYDSVVISADTLIGNEIFYRFVRFSKMGKDFEYNSSSYCRDSLRYLIDNYGNKMFSEDNFIDTLRYKTELAESDTIYKISFKMEKESAPLNIDAGEFSNLLNFKGTVICNHKYTKIPNPRFTKNYFARGVGKVYYTNIWIGSGGEQIYSLLRYKVQ